MSRLAPITSRCIVAAVAAALFFMNAIVSSAADRYREPFRPQFHFTPEKNWMNDPNGMVYFDGEYHLFYQYNPFGNTWGHMSWGHAVSTDLVHWEHLPLALAEEDGIMIFSGSAVVDWNNTSGLGKNGQPPLIAIYTGHREGRQDQRIAYSHDRGRTWTKFADNPVLDLKMADFRDPKVFWHEPTARWVMTVALATEQKVHFYTSPDLKQWEYVGEFGPARATNGLWECPDLFPLPVEGGGTKWVLIVNINPGGPAGGSGCQYFIGDFDGRNFKVDPLPADLAEFVPDGKLLADFENGYGDWQAEGEAFGTEPAPGMLPNQQPVAGFRGKRLVNSFHGGDQSQGTLTSRPFEITASHISFLIGGGAHPETRIDLRVDGQTVRTASGRDREQLAWQSWDVAELRGKQAALQIVDQHSGGWGHINVDQILLAEEPARPADDGPLWADFGPDFYAAVSWSDIPASDGRRLWLGWMSNWQYANDVPTTPWRSAMSIPRELQLFNTPQGIRLRQIPVRELQRLRDKPHHFTGGTVAAANDWLKDSGLRSGPLEVTVEFPAADAGTEGLTLFQGSQNETVIRIDRAEGTVTLDRQKSGNVAFHKAFPGSYSAPLARPREAIRLRIFIDDSSIELFVNDGEQVLTALVFPDEDSRGLDVFGRDGESAVTSLRGWALKSAWK